MPDRPFSMVTARPTPRQTRLALLVSVALFVAFAVSVPFAAKQLPRIDSFVPTVEAIVFVTDLATAVLLFGQFAIINSRALLILASGYFYSSSIVTSHVLSFPGAFAPHGLFSTGIQATPWLYTFWHFGFSAAVLAYAWMRRWAGERDIVRSSPASAAWLSSATVMVLVCALTWVVIAREPYLPPASS
jgi:hypothetical protein